MSPKSAHYHFFLLGLWAESEAGEWRFSLEDPHTGERKGFRNLGELTAFLEKWMKTQKQFIQKENST